MELCPLVLLILLHPRSIHCRAWNPINSKQYLNKFPSHRLLCEYIIIIMSSRHPHNNIGIIKVGPGIWSNDDLQYLSTFFLFLLSIHNNMWLVELNSCCNELHWEWIRISCKTTTAPKSVKERPELHCWGCQVEEEYLWMAGKHLY